MINISKKIEDKNERSKHQHPQRQRNITGTAHKNRGFTGVVQLYIVFRQI